MAGQITFQNTAVNSGTAVVLQSATVTYSWSNLTNSTPVPGKYAVVETDVGGWENPKIIIRGVIDVGNIPTNHLTQALLTSFAKLQFDGTTTTPVKVTVVSGGDGTIDVYLRNNDDTQNYLYCVVDSFNIKFGTDVVNERKWVYSITLTETETS